MARFSVAAFLATAALAYVAAQEQVPNRRDVTIVAHQQQFAPDRFEVSQDDLVRVTLVSDEHPRSFALDAYRIVKRVAAVRRLCSSSGPTRPARSRSTAA